MSVYYQDAAMQLLLGDVREEVRRMPDSCVQTCVTSPPYWALRDYGMAQWAGGNQECDHLRTSTATESSTLSGGPQHGINNELKSFAIGKCRKCGAIRIDRQIGMESTPEAYVGTMVEVFRDVRRVLKNDGTLWLNLGSTYKAKDMVPIPWMVAQALQADGWYLRADIIWAKSNPLPESVQDRPTKAHEYIFLLAKSAQYYYDYEAIQEPASLSSDARRKQHIAAQAGSNRVPGKTNGPMKAVGGPMSVKKRGHARPHEGFNAQWDQMTKAEQCGGMRNKRSVWTVAAPSGEEEHYATYPPKLIEPCILAGSRVGDVVLDPFNGSGTTALVAKQFNRRYIGIDLSESYLAMSLDRLRQEVLPLDTQGA